MLHGFLGRWLFSPYVLEMVTARGGDAAQWREQWVSALEEWRNDPGAMGAFAMGECIGYKPWHRQSPASPICRSAYPCRGGKMP